MFELKKTHVEKATAYMPIAEKMAEANEIAKACVKYLQIPEDKAQSDMILVLPRIVGEDTALKTVLLTNVLVSFYLGIDVNVKGGDYLDEYGNIYNQIRRIARNEESVKDKCFDILEDFHTFRTIVDTEIHNLIAANNDTLVRLSAGIALNIKSETLKKLSDELKKIEEAQNAENPTETATTEEKAEEKA